MSLAPAVTVAALDRLGRDLGALQEEHGQGVGPRAPELLQYADDPVGFDLLAGRNPTDYQRAVMESVAQHRFTAWRGCHGCGKEFTAGSVAKWAAYPRGMLVLLVSATEGQAIGQTMREVAAALRAHGNLRYQRFRRSIRIDGEDRIIALTGSASVDALTGWHDANGVMVIISEGQGERLEDVAYDAALSVAVDERSRVLAMGNPVRPDGRFYEINRKPGWNVFRTSAFDTPNVRAGRTVRAGFPSPGWPAEMEAEYGGTDSAFYQGRVLAEFPTEAEDAAFPRDAIERAVERWRTGALSERAQGQPYTLGADPAFTVDEFAVSIWRGPIAEGFRVRHKLEAPEAVGWLVEIMRELRQARMGSDVRTVCIDEIGVGATMPRLLRDALRANPWEWPGVRVVGVNISRPPGERERFQRRKCELVWALREALVNDRIAIPPDEKLLEELREQRVRQTADGKIEAEDKDKMRRRLGRSPDRLDALLLGLSPRVPDGRRQFLFGVA